MLRSTPVMATMVDCASSLVLHEDLIVANILHLLGPGEWLFVASISKHFRQSYEKYLEAQAGRTLIQHVTYVSRTFHTAPRLRLAIAAGLELSNGCLCEFAGRYGTEASLSLAREMGLPWTKTICTAAASSGRFKIALWLHIDKSCPWDVSEIRLAAARYGEYELCTWLWRQTDVRWTKEDLVCWTAAHHGHTDILAWMHGAGCLWEEKSGLTLAACAGGSVSALRWLHS
ncbi:hypothetical protein JKP88DRAFT_267203, partial [Tribonema minus]